MLLVPILSWADFYVNSPSNDLTPAARRLVDILDKVGCVHLEESAAASWLCAKSIDVPRCLYHGAGTFDRIHPCSYNPVGSYKNPARLHVLVTEKGRLGWPNL